MDKKPTVSIIMPTFNSGRFVAESIRSIQQQDFTDWELLITDDCSTDNTADVVEEIAQSDKRVRFFKLDKNSGPCVARNHSIKESQGRYIAFCDSDDRWYPQKLSRQLAFMDEKQCALCYSSYVTCDEQGGLTGIVSCNPQETKTTILHDDGIGCLTAIYDTERVGGKMMMPTLRKRQDWCLFMEIIRKSGTAYGIQEPLAILRKRHRSVSSNKFSLVKYNVAAYQVVLGWSRIRAILYFMMVFMPTYTIKRMRIKISNKSNLPELERQHKKLSEAGLV